MPTFETLLTPEQSASFTDAGLWRNRTIVDSLDHHAEATPDKVAFVDSRGSLTFGELRDRSRRCAQALLDLGVGRDDVVSFQLPNWIEWIVVHYAVCRIGAISNPLIPIYREREVGFMMALAESKVMIVPATFRGFDYPAMIASLQPTLPDLEHVIVVDGPAREGTVSWETFLSSVTEVDEERIAALRPDPDDVTLVIFTSGTTGEPKGVMHTHNTLGAATAPLPERVGITADTVFHMASTLAHLTGFLYGARLNVENGATCVLQDVWDPAVFVDLVEAHGISYTSAATPFLHDLLAQPDLASRNLDSLALFCCMGAPIPRAIVRQAKESLPGMTVLGGWGQTENGLVTLGIPGDPENKIVETDGYPWPGMEVRVRGITGEEVTPGDEGDLQVRGPSLFVGYAKRMQMSRDSFEDGWFRTGDLAKIEDGYVNISGRTKDVIIRGGENIPVVYVENVVYEHPDVLACAVVGIPDRRLQERAACCVVLKEGAGDMTLSDLQSFLGEKGVAKQYWPESFQVMDDLPRTASGKIQKYKLRDALAARASEPAPTPVSEDAPADIEPV